MTTISTPPFSAYRAKIGDKITVPANGTASPERLTLTVSHIAPPMSGGRRESEGPQITAHTRPGGYSITIDATTKGVEVAK